MNPLNSTFVRMLLVCVLFITVSQAQDKNAPKVPQAEADAAQKVQSGKDLAAKFKAAEEFMKKYSKSSVRSKVANYLAIEVGNVTDANQRVSYIAQYSKLFNSPEEQDLILPAQVDSLALSGKLDEAFKMAPKVFEKSPDNVYLYTQLALKGTNEVRTGKMELAEQSKQFGEKAIQLLEANKKQEGMDDKYFADFKQQFLPELYQAVGLISYAGQNYPDAKKAFEKNLELSPKNAFAYLMLAEIANAEYQKVGMEYNVASGPEKDKLLKQAEAKLDTAIDLYARTVALAEGSPQYKPMKDQVMEQLQTYYKFRNKGSLDGLQKLIDKYKP